MFWQIQFILILSVLAAGVSLTPMDEISSSEPLEAVSSSSRQPNLDPQLDTTVEVVAQSVISTENEVLKFVESAKNDGDDDVQIIFSVPRRRKKRRKRIESSSLNPRNERAYSRSGRELMTAEGEHSAPASQRDVSSDEPVHATEERPILPGIHVSAIGPSVYRPFQDAQHTPYVSPYGPPCQSSDLTSLPNPRWESSSTRPYLNQTHDVEWRPLQVDENMNRKRRHHGDWEFPQQQRFHFRQSMQISPRTHHTPSSTTPYSTSGIGFGHQDMYGRPVESHSPQASWPSFDWSSFNDANTNHFISQSLQQAAMGNDTLLANRLLPKENFHQHQIDAEVKPANTAHTYHQPGCPKSMESGTFQTTSNHFFNESQKVCVDPPVLSTQLSPSPSSHISAGTSASPLAPQHQQVEPKSSSERPALQLAPTENNFQKPNPIRVESVIARPPDIVRKPSLYRIPPWPPSSSSHGQSNRRSSSDTLITSQPPPAPIKTDQRILSRPAFQLDNTITIQAEQANSGIPTTPSNGEFHIPKARAGRKNSPNLIVDIAETCQEIFPFATVAERHKVPLKKVFDTFSAIIQLPLLRNADDRRRHGSLGKRRVKEYRDARKAMERAQEVERKAQMKALRARVDEATRQGKLGSISITRVSAEIGPVGRPDELRRTAVLNHAMEIEGAGLRGVTPGIPVLGSEVLNRS